MHTVDRMVVPGPLRWEPVRLPPRRRGPTMAVGGLIVAAILSIALLAPVPYYAISPGSALPVASLISAPPDRSFESDGAVLLTTVRVGPTSLGQALTGWVDSTVDVVEEEVILGPQTDPDEYRTQTLQAMDTSKQTAIAVALRRLGHDVQLTGSGAVIGQLVAGAPAAQVLQVGDVITAIDGAPVRSASEAVDAIRSKQPGQPVTITVRRGGGTQDVRLTLGQRPDDGSPFIGASLETADPVFTPPFPVDIRSEEIGGPSAGLAFTLGLLERLAPGPLTGGATIAASGTIEADGTVGEVGGLVQKAVAVQRAGASLFIVPADRQSTEAARAKAVVGDGLVIEPVSTLQEALDVLARHGGDLTGIPPAGAP